jgi:hypothetical protein
MADEPIISRGFRGRRSGRTSSRIPPDSTRARSRTLRRTNAAHAAVEMGFHAARAVDGATAKWTWDELAASRDHDAGHHCVASGRSSYGVGRHFRRHADRRAAARRERRRSSLPTPTAGTTNRRSPTSPVEGMGRFGTTGSRCIRHGGPARLSCRISTLEERQVGARDSIHRA